MRVRHYFLTACFALTGSIAAAQGPLLTSYRLGPAFSSGGPVGIAAGVGLQLNSPDYSGKTSGDPLPVSITLDVVHQAHFTNFPILLNLRLDPNSVDTGAGTIFYELGVGAQWSSGDEGSGMRFAYGASAGVFLNSARSLSLEVRYYGSSNSRTNSLALLGGFRI